MPPISLLIKPASSSCNLKCKYCFYYDVAENRTTQNYGRMKIELLEQMVQKALEYADHSCTFAFQGGEPTLAGLDFYKRLVEFENKYNSKKLKVHHAIQTNGIVVNEEWARFFADNDFLVGISLDGPKEIHDANRIDARKDGSFNRVMKTIDLFNKFRVQYNVLFVVHGYVARHVQKIYTFYKKKGFKYLQFIPCLDPLYEMPGGNEYSLTPQKFVYFLKNLFDLWYTDILKGDRVSIRYFDNLVGMFMGYRPEACGMLGECQCQFVVEADGSVYPCDFYVLDEWWLGNLKDQGFGELQNSETGQKFIELSRLVDPKCKECKWVDVCRGGCRRDREPFVEGRPGLNHYCEAYREFFEYAGVRLQQVAAIFVGRP